MSQQSVSHSAQEILEACGVFEAALKISLAIGAQKRRASLDANAVAKRVTGVDLLGELRRGGQPSPPRRPSLDWEGAASVMNYIAGRDNVTVAEVAAALFPGSDSPATRWRVAKVLRSLGWHGHRCRHAGGWTSTWARPDASNLPQGGEGSAQARGNDSP